MNMDIDQANTTAVDRMMEARPILKAVAPAREVTPGMKDNLFLHAGPPMEWTRMSGPLRGAVIGAMLFEGLASNETEAAPMVGVISASMKVYVVENVEDGNQSFSNLNEGYRKVLRYGAYIDEVLRKLRWMND